MIRARVEPELKREAEELFSSLGLSTTEAITLFYRQVTLHQGLPFAVRMPNLETVEALEQARDRDRPHGVRQPGRPQSQIRLISCVFLLRRGSRGISDAPRGVERTSTKLWTIVERLLSGQSLDARNRPHRLSGAWSHCWECHIEPDWLLIWDSSDDDMLILVRTGSHSDLFG